MKLTIGLLIGLMIGLMCGYQIHDNGMKQLQNQLDQDYNVILQTEANQ